MYVTFPSNDLPNISSVATVAIIATEIPLHLSSTTSGTALHTSRSSSHPHSHSGKYRRTLKAFVMAGKVSRVLCLVSFLLLCSHSSRLFLSSALLAVLVVLAL